MPPNKETKEEELKQEFYNFCDDNGFNPLRSECIDFWLSKRKEELSKLKEKIEKEKTEGKYPWQALHFQDCPNCGLEVNRKYIDEKCKEIRNEGLDFVLALFKEVEK